MFTKRLGENFQALTSPYPNQSARWLSVVLPPGTGMNRSHSKAASREPRLMLVITAPCPERRSPRGANEQIPSLASPVVLCPPDLQLRVFLDSCLSSHPTSNPSADLLGLWFKCSYGHHHVGHLRLEMVQRLPAVSQLPSVDTQPVSHPKKKGGPYAAQNPSPSDWMAWVTGLPWQSSG